MSNLANNRVLHNYFRSSSSYRVRIAMNLKGLDYTYLPVHLNRNGGEQFSQEFMELNPHSLVPVFTEPGIQLTQSLAIMEYLEEKYPEVPLLPSNIDDRAYVRQLSLAIACEIHPLNNLRVLKFLTGGLGLDEESKNKWIHHWIGIGLAGLEDELSKSTRRGMFCLGDSPSMADCCLVPQLFNAQRFNVDMSPYPSLMAIDRACQAIPAFVNAHPAHQIDSE